LQSSLFEVIPPANVESTLKTELKTDNPPEPTFNGVIPGTLATGFGWNITGSGSIVGVVGEENKKHIETYNDRIKFNRQADGLLGPSPPPVHSALPPPPPQSQGGQFVYYYRMGGDGNKYNIATQAIVNAINDTCTRRFQPPDSPCAPNAFETAPIRFVDSRRDKATDDWMADIEMVVGNQIKTVLQGLIVRAGPTTQQNIKKYNDAIDNTYASWGARMNSGGGAKNKKKPNRRSNRRHSYRRHKASRRRTCKK
jgi:hypothetical protein